MYRVVISIIIYKSNLEILLKSLKILDSNKNGLEYAFVIIDNNEGAQIDALKAMVSENLSLAPLFTYIKSPNIGFGAGHNLAFRTVADTEFDYFLCANPDGIFHPDCVINLVEFAKKCRDNGIFEALQFPLEHPKYYHITSWKTDWCSGCLIMFPKKVFGQLNGFDEDFFMYMEDVDISWRARAIGYKCYTVCNALFMHDTLNNGRDNARMKEYMRKSGAILAKKYNAPTFMAFCGGLKDDKIEQRQDLARFDSIKNFRRLFHFSKVRW